MTQLIAHRRNTIEELRSTPTTLGVEVDIRSEGGRLIIHHDAFTRGEDFEVWMGAYQHSTLILNVKEEGLEQSVLDCMARHGKTDFFFLDQSFPFLIKWANKGERRCAVRVSEFESIETALALAGRVDWVWVDCFTRFPLSEADWQRLKAAGFKLCLVSPELLGRDALIEIPEIQSTLQAARIEMDAVCTKRPDLWGYVNA